MNQIDTVRVRLRYADLDAFVEKFAPNITRGGVFLATRAVKPVGAVIGFEIQLISGQVALAGQGKIVWVKEFDPAEPTRPYGMGLQFTAIEQKTRQVLAHILRTKDVVGAPRRATAVLTTLVGAAAPAPPPVNGRRATVVLPPVDTSTDLAAEFGIDEATLRRALDRRWAMGVRPDDEDLEALLRPEAFPPPTLAQALAELPRLLDPQSSRRRATGMVRPLEALVMSGSGRIGSPSRREDESPSTEIPIDVEESTGEG